MSQPTSKMSLPIEILIGFLLLLGCAIYVYGVSIACIYSLDKPLWDESVKVREMDSFLSGAVTTIAAVLSTNLGAILGIATSNTASSLNKLSTWNPIRIFTNPDPTVFQTTACYIYVLSLVAAGIVWLILGFKEDSKNLVALIPEMTKTLLGVIVGALAISLNTQTK